MNLIKYRDDIRAVAFLAINKSRHKNVILVEGNDDVAFYQYFFSFDITEVDNAKCDSTTNPNSNSNKDQVIKMKNIISILEPNNKKICYIIDKDYDATISNPPLFVTDYHSVENYVLVSHTDAIKPLEEVAASEKWQKIIDHYNENCEVKYDGVDPLKKLHGKKLKKILMHDKLRWSILMAHVPEKNVPIVKRIKEYLKI